LSEAARHIPSLHFTFASTAMTVVVLGAEPWHKFERDG